MRVRSILTASAMLAMLGVAPAASAQSKAAEKAGEVRFQEGKALLRAGHPEEARLAFAQAYAVYPEIGVLWNLAVSEMDTHLLLEALQHLRAWKADPRASSPGFQRHLPEAQDRIAKILAQTAHFTVEGADASAVQIDGAALTSAVHEGSIYDVLPGHHTFQATAAGPTQAQELDLQAGTTTTVKFAPPPRPEPTPAITPLTSTDAVVSTEHPDRVTAPTEAHPSSAKIATVAILGGVGVALLVGGGVELADANSEETTRATLAAQNLCGGASATGGCASLHDATTARNTDHDVGVGLLVGGGVSVVAGLATWFLWPNHKETPGSVTFVPWVGPQHAGMNLTGSF